ncbi:MAG: helix-turn-helix transcriptional regulator [Bacteroidales bacterium]|nr:helix-turn-helix transcriptional regulator [Bacteroidales bacterium]
MEEIVNQRIADVIKWSAMSQRKFAETIDISQMIISSLFTRGSKPSCEMMRKIVKAFPQIDAHWLLTGEGKMIKEEENVQVVSVESEELPYITNDIVQSRNIDIRDLLESNSERVLRRSLTDLIGTDVDYVQRVITSAMAPLFMPGDMLFIRFLPVDANLISGAIYLIDTKSYGAMVRQIYVEKDRYVLHSLNSDYTELCISIENIYSIGIVVKSLRADFNLPHDTHTSKEQLDKILDSNARLIDELIKQNERSDKLIDKIING